MSRRRLLLGALAALASLTALAPGAAQAQPLVTGVTNLFTTDSLAFQRVKSAGANFVRIPAYWGGIAPEDKPDNWNPGNPDDSHYQWGEVDEAVRNAIAAGVTPLVVVDGAPKWAQRCQTPPSLVPAICDLDPEALREFGKALARHFDGSKPSAPKVTYFQALNEPNLSIFFLPQFETDLTPVSPRLYRDLINNFYSGVKSAAPGSIVVLAGLGPIAVPRYTVGPLRFTRLMLCMKGGKKPKPIKGDCKGPVKFDVFAIQPYTTGGPTHIGGPNDVQLGSLERLQELIKAADRAGHIKGRYKRTPLWITEFSWDSKPPDPRGLPMAIEVRWVAEALHQAWSAGIDHFFWFSLRDEAREGRPSNIALESGLYFRGPSLAQDKPKPLLKAFRFPFVAYPGKPFGFWGRTPTSRPGRVAIQVQGARGWTTVARPRANRYGIFQGKVLTDYGAGQKGAARAVFGKEISPAFSMKPVPDFYHPPFG